LSGKLHLTIMLLLLCWDFSRFLFWKLRKKRSS